MPVRENEGLSLRAATERPRIFRHAAQDHAYNLKSLVQGWGSASKCPVKKMLWPMYLGVQYRPYPALKRNKFLLAPPQKNLRVSRTHKGFRWHPMCQIPEVRDDLRRTVWNDLKPANDWRKAPARPLL